jgi:ASPM-SPD-2-Hydin domain-containing protein
VLSSSTAQNYNPTFSSSITTIDIMTAYKDGGSGGGSAGVSLSPTSLTFASQAVGTSSAAQTVTLTNTGTASLSISSIVASAQYAQTNTCGSSVAAGANCTISVTFTPSATGSQPGTITVTDNATGSPQTVSLTGTGQ